MAPPHSPSSAVPAAHSTVLGVSVAPRPLQHGDEMGLPLFLWMDEHSSTLWEVQKSTDPIKDCARFLQVQADHLC